ncbi:hypothetical protein CYMTET_34250 [Cymbomonas tetramitiformis]|uniref:Uncharacterized protein n=1 Tax=Cymbomonas tetramitiformis TaxID=36881 RepID=A0AAE0FBL9_9CHLO|nr:hypothetical protein CYMTET_34250 [Cymbomonas tetramitiformis]
MNEAGEGKDETDSSFNTAKSYVRRLVNLGKLDAKTAIDFVGALNSGHGISGMVARIVEIDRTAMPTEIGTLDQITRFSHYRHETAGLRLMTHPAKPEAKVKEGKRALNALEAKREELARKREAKAAAVEASRRDDSLSAGPRVRRSYCPEINTDITMPARPEAALRYESTDLRHLGEEYDPYGCKPHGLDMALLLADVEVGDGACGGKWTLVLGRPQCDKVRQGYAMKSRVTPQQKTEEQVRMLEQAFLKGLERGGGRSSRESDQDVLNAINAMSPPQKQLRLDQVTSRFSRRYSKYVLDSKNARVRAESELARATQQLQSNDTEMGTEVPQVEAQHEPATAEHLTAVLSFVEKMVPTPVTDVAPTTPKDTEMPGAVLLAETGTQPVVQPLQTHAPPVAANESNMAENAMLVDDEQEISLNEEEEKSLVLSFLQQFAVS